MSSDASSSETQRVSAGVRAVSVRFPPLQLPPSAGTDEGTLPSDFSAADFGRRVCAALLPTKGGDGLSELAEDAGDVRLSDVYAAANKAVFEGASCDEWEFRAVCQLPLAADGSAFPPILLPSSVAAGDATLGSVVAEALRRAPRRLRDGVPPSGVVMVIAVSLHRCGDGAAAALIARNRMREAAIVPEPIPVTEKTLEPPPSFGGGGGLFSFGEQPSPFGIVPSSNSIPMGSFGNFLNQQGSGLFGNPTFGNPNPTFGTFGNPSPAFGTFGNPTGQLDKVFLSSLMPQQQTLF